MSRPSAEHSLPVECGPVEGSEESAPRPSRPSPRLRPVPRRGGEARGDTPRWDAEHHSGRPGRSHRPPNPVLTAIGAGLLALTLIASGVWWLSERSPEVSGTGRAVANPFYRLEVAVDPTPVFATYRSLRIHLPVPDENVTQLAFHQASFPSALHLTSLVPDADARRVAKTRTMIRHERPAIAAEEAQGAPAVFNGEALRLWRTNRNGLPDSAADVGAIPGTAVYAPVTGEVTAVRRYFLYGKYEDFELHIRPKGWDDVECVLIHVAEPIVQRGDVVIGGVTPIAEVRRLSNREELQLGQYTKDGGDHVHVQLNGIQLPGQITTLDGS